MEGYPSSGSAMNHGGITSGALGLAQTSAQYDDRANHAPKSMPLIAQQFEVTIKSIEAIHDAITRLETRVNAVLRQEPSQTSGRDEVRLTPSVPLAAVLVETNARLQAAYVRLQSLVDRVEL